MITITKKLPLDFHFSFDYLEENDCVLDIETTGFSRTQNMIYLIGCIYKKENELFFIQWLCEKEVDEYELLYTFQKFCKPFKRWIHFNGQAFDVPFILSRMEVYQIQHPFADMLQMDLFRVLKPLKSTLSLPNFKLKTLLDILGFKRLDPFDGGELIEIFFNFILTSNEREKHALKTVLLLHNEEDVIGTLKCCDMLELMPLVSGNLSLNSSGHVALQSPLQVYKHPDSRQLIVHYTNPRNYPITFKRISTDTTLSIQANNLTLTFHLVHRKLRYYFSDFQNYVYLPLENKVVHKSVGRFVEASYREKATKENAYIENEDWFIQIPSSPEKSITKLRDSLCRDFPDIQFFRSPAHPETYYVLPDTILNLSKEASIDFIKSCIQIFMYI